jgi:hypothetical protein
MKTGPDDIGTVKNRTGQTAENESESAKHETGHDTLSIAKMTPGAQNMKSGADSLVTTENESESAKHENETRRPRYRQK